jgi:hypothetical protein
MAESSSRNLPSHASLDELVEFFDTHDMGDYLEEMPEVEFTVNLKSRRHLVALEEEVAHRLTEIARTQQVSAEALVNSWLKERISNLPKKRKSAS